MSAIVRQYGDHSRLPIFVNSSPDKYYSFLLLTDIINPGGFFLGAEATVGIINIGITTCTIAPIELALAQIHLRLSKLRIHFSYFRE